ncbi:hypothetical protein ACFYO2_20390 [Streptomyces sp. NPDC006602]|uniref:hypothetical protein n=1 Tax=Streptomyces sp. NPDC006602 TaxID=3364751 RepID=UPI0036D18D5B
MAASSGIGYGPATVPYASRRTETGELARGFRAAMDPDRRPPPRAAQPPRPHRYSLRE